ncbi:MAG: RNA 2',3'-cyclic phosphodiesterase [Chloroflexota bacterium]
MTERWRCFVAIPIGDALRAALSAASAPWQTTLRDTDVRWMDPASWHVTLAFLGDVDPDHVPVLAEQLPELVAQHAPVQLVPEGLVAWPRVDETRMVWCRFRPESAICELHNRVAGSLGTTERRRFRPHVTLARVRGGRSLELADQVGAGDAAAPVLPTTVAHEVTLYRSHLDPAGTTYEALARAPLGAVPA